MEYVYIPDSYDNNMISSKFKSRDEFLDMQVLYKNTFERYICRSIDLNSIDQRIEQLQVNIPVVEDNEYNFYHKYSALGSKYVFLRNNIHIEKLTPEEIMVLKERKGITPEFIKSTYERVVYEDGDEVFFGSPIDENIVRSKSIVFEFAYDQKECETLEQLSKIKEIIDGAFQYINENLSASFEMPFSFIVYKAVPPLYQKKESTVHFM